MEGAMLELIPIRNLPSGEEPKLFLGGPYALQGIDCAGYS